MCPGLDQLLWKGVCVGPFWKDKDTKIVKFNEDCHNIDSRRETCYDACKAIENVLLQMFVKRAAEVNGSPSSS